MKGQYEEIKTQVWEIYHSDDKNTFTTESRWIQGMGDRKNAERKWVGCSFETVQ